MSAPLTTSGVTSSERILIVDDNEAGRYTKARILSKSGYAVSEAATGQAAREALRTNSFALVLLDVKLPDVNGIVLAREIKNALPFVIILQTSAAFISQKDRAAGLAGGADNYLIEPIDPVELVATVESLLRRYRTEQELREKHHTLQQVVAERGEQIAEIDARLRTEMGQRVDAEDMLRHAQKLDVLGQLTGGIAHDFNNVLTIVMGNLESLRRQLATANPDLDRVRTYTDSAFSGARRAIGITRQLLAFSRRQALAPHVLDINAFIGNLSQILKQILGEKIVAKTQLSKDLWPVRCDADQLETVILNLAINARDAMPKGGTLTITTANETRDGKDWAVVRVADTGAGMSADVLKMVFEPFFTTKDVGHGTGLGLSQVHGFVRQSGGSVTIDSIPDRGTVVILNFPRYVGDEQAVGPAQQSSEGTVNTSHRARILVTEDDDLVRNHSVGILREMGHTVFEAANGLIALDVLHANPGIDVLFTDIGLAGGMSGPDLGRKAAALRPALKILYTTGYDPTRIAKEELAENADIIVKPFTYDALARKLEGLLSDVIHSGTILMVEDEPMIRMDTAMSLRDMGYEVVEAGTLADGLKEIREHGGDFGAVVVDIGLPDGRGDDVVTSLRIRHKRTPVIITTGYADPALHAKFDKDDCTKFLSKPYFPDEVADALRGMGISK